MLPRAARTYGETSIARIIPSRPVLLTDHQRGAGSPGPACPDFRVPLGASYPFLAAGAGGSDSADQGGGSRGGGGGGGGGRGVAW